MLLPCLLVRPSTVSLLVPLFFLVVLSVSAADDSDAAALQSFPTLKYGTAWKKERTADLVYQAIKAGFRHVDTACQPRHYHEPGVGEGWTRAAEELGLTRQDIWLQTKYTSVNSQDPQRIPYDQTASKADQVRQSVEISLQNLKTDYIDSLVMHGPEDTWEDMFEVWGAFEEMVDSGKVRQLGISNNYHFPAVKFLHERARIKPKVVQNRFYGESGYDVDIRNFCLKNEMEYQSFWTLGANRHFSEDARVIELAKSRHVSPEVFLYATAMKLGITPLDGTTNPQHMAEDMDFLKRIQQGEEIVKEDELPMLIEIIGIPPPSEQAEEEEEL